jgi:hypothetical protein
MAIIGYKNSNYAIRQGFVNAAQLTSTYYIRNFVKTSDMGPHQWWNPEGNNLYNQGAIAERTLNGGRNFTGNPFFSWRLPGLTPQMLNFWLYDATMFNGSAQMDSTVGTWNGLRDRWEIVWAVASVGIVSESGEPGFYRGLRALNVDFVVKQDAP